VTTSPLCRMTSQRKVILEELCKVDSHPTADRIYEMVRRRLPRISLGTVYRNLESMAQAGMIGKHEAAGSQRRYDGNPAGHYHVRCVSCGRLADVSVEAEPALDHLVRMDRGYRILGHRLEFVGICPACRQEKECDTSNGSGPSVDGPVKNKGSELS